MMGVFLTISWGMREIQM